MPNNMKMFFMFLSIFSFIPTTLASQEGILSFEEFNIKSNGIGNSGKVVISGKKDGNGNFLQISVEAFGKIIQIPPAILNQLQSEMYNGIQVSYEAGYKVLGGKVVYLQFHVGFTSGIRKLIIVAIKESGHVQVLSE